MTGRSAPRAYVPPFTGDEAPPSSPVNGPDPSQGSPDSPSSDDE